MVAPNPLAALSRAVAEGHADGPLAGLGSLATLRGDWAGHHRFLAVEAHLEERAGNITRAAGLFAQAADRAPSTAERAHLLRRLSRVQS